MLKAVLFDFNGVIINDEPIHKRLIKDLFLQENLFLKESDFQQCCMGRTDRACFRDLFARYHITVSDDYLSRLIDRKVKSYEEHLATLPEIPLYPGLDAFFAQLHAKGLLLGLVTGTRRADAEAILQKVRLSSHFQVIVGGDEVTRSKPDPQGYLLGLERLNQRFPEIAIANHNCLVIEDSLVGITAAKQAGMQVVGIAHTYPFHFMQRRAHWAIDDFSELDLERIEKTFALL